MNDRERLPRRGGSGPAWRAGVLAVALLPLGLAADWSLEWPGVGGGGTSAGGQFVVTGGTESAGVGSSTGLGFGVTAGFWGPLAELQAPPPLLSVELAGSAVVLSWPAEAGTYQLEQARALEGTPIWERVNHATNVVGGRVVVGVEASGTAAFFRLHRP